MDYTFEKSWSDTLDKISKQFGEKLEYAAILMLIGAQELGKDHQQFKKDQKIELMHIGICSVLQQFGYYSYIGRDNDGWPHFERTESLPPLKPEEQELLIRKAIVKYFDDFAKVK
ncbi:MAG: hypothetical protein SH856_10090 [Flavobacteriales bacterium]|nr:hypothetical protein [Flavobacteriales bacterium]